MKCLTIALEQQRKPVRTDIPKSRETFETDLTLVMWHVAQGRASDARSTGRLPIRLLPAAQSYWDLLPICASHIHDLKSSDRRFVFIYIQMSIPLTYRTH